MYTHRTSYRTTISVHKTAHWSFYFEGAPRQNVTSSPTLYDAGKMALNVCRGCEMESFASEKTYENDVRCLQKEQNAVGRWLLRKTIQFWKHKQEETIAWQAKWPRASRSDPPSLDGPWIFRISAMPHDWKSEVSDIMNTNVVIVQIRLLN